MPDLSDHCSISFNLKTNAYFTQPLNNNYEYIKKPSKITWDKNNKARLQKKQKTADHLLIVRFVIDKYVKIQGKVPRSKLFYTLLRDYLISGNYLNILQEMYK